FWSSSALTFWAANVWDSPGRDGGGDTPGADEGSAGAGHAELLLRNDRWIAGVSRTVIGERFDPALGFVQRPDQKTWGGQLAFTPRFQSSRWARQLTLQLAGDRIEGMDGALQSRDVRLSTRMNFQTGDFANIDVNDV